MFFVSDRKSPPNPCADPGSSQREEIHIPQYTAAICRREVRSSKLRQSSEECQNIEEGQSSCWKWVVVVSAYLFFLVFSLFLPERGYYSAYTLFMPKKTTQTKKQNKTINPPQNERINGSIIGYTVPLNFYFQNLTKVLYLYRDRMPKIYSCIPRKFDEGFTFIRAFISWKFDESFLLVSWKFVKSCLTCIVKPKAYRLILLYLSFAESKPMYMRELIDKSLLPREVMFHADDDLTFQLHLRNNTVSEKFTTITLKNMYEVTYLQGNSIFHSKYLMVDA